MILDCITHDINPLTPPTPSPLCTNSVQTPYLVHTLFSDRSRSFWLLSLLEVGDQVNRSLLGSFTPVIYLA